MVAPTGARLGKADHATLPITTDEIVKTAHLCKTAGAHSLHLHIRDDAGLHSLDDGRYREVLKELSAQIPDMRVQITTESADLFDVSEQLNCLAKVQPRWASISVREIARDPDLAHRIYGCCEEQRTGVQHILYDVSDITLLKKWQHEGIVRPSQNSVLFVLGRYSEGQISSPTDLIPFLKAMSSRKQWMICAFGPREHECMVEAAQLGGNLRVGFENSLSDKNANFWSANSASVAALKTKLGK